MLRFTIETAGTNKNLSLLIGNPISIGCNK